jgi:response regulator RpfG family c-di-GMP phosphodiesterase
MESKYEHTLLLVDDEASILKALQRLFRREGYRVLAAQSGEDALDLLENTQTPISLIISDQRMPGMNGATFLERSVARCPDAVRFLLTGYSDMDAVVDAVNKGQINRYLAKPWNDTEILMLVRESMNQVELKLENARLTELTKRQNQELTDLNKSLEEKVKERTWALKYQNKMLQRVNDGLGKSLIETVRLLLSLVESSNPRLGKYMKAVAQVARGIAIEAKLGKEIQDRVEMAGLVHDIGLLGMPESVLTKDERLMSRDEFEAYAQHPEIAALCLSSVEGLKPIGAIVRAHHENIDGSGFPDRNKGSSLSKETRILAVAADYCTVLHLWPQGVKAMFSVARRYLDHEALSTVEIGPEPNVRRAIAEKVIVAGAGKRYDGAVVRHFRKSIGSTDTRQRVSKFAFNLLSTGMILMDDLRLKDGRLLLTRGTILGDGALQSIQTIGNRGLIESEIAVAVGTVKAPSGEVEA